MKKILFLITYFLWISLSKAEDYAWILWYKTVEDIRNWNIHLNDLPNMVRYAIDIFLALVWTISLIFIIVWAYQIIFGSLSDNKTKWKDTIIMALSGFAFASLAWFIIKFILDNIS